jgi:predicted negative regulator of RcsB-dependent stress response
MSLPASEPNEPRSELSTPATQPPQEFDLLAFWIQHQKLITRLFIAALLGVVVWGAFLFMDYRRRAGSAEALGSAKTSAEYRKVTADWAGTPAAGTAFVRLAEELRKEGKPAEAAQALREFIDQYRLHPLRIPAAHSLASSLETAGKLDEALVAYQRFGSDNAASTFAPLAFIGQARVLRALGKPEEARKVLESVEQKFQSNPLMREATMLLDELKNPAALKTGGAPRPALPPAPAPPPPALKLDGGAPAPLPPGAAIPPISITPPPAPTAPVTPPAPAAPSPAPAAPAPADPVPPAPSK